MFDSALEVLKKIEENGFKAYIVGGYPRDLYLNRKSADVDICTNARPKNLTNIFPDTKISSIDYGCVIVKHNNIMFAVTTFRSDDTYLNHRNPVNIKYVNDLLEDLKRRDFIINTLCIDSNAQTIDLLNAKYDLNNKIIRVVGDTYKKIEEDALRILRALRFATILDFSLDEELVSAIKKYKNNLKQLSYFRKMEELDKIFSSPNNKKGIKLLKELDLEEVLDINLDINITSSSIAIWAQINNLTYPFSKTQREIITKINELKDKNILDYNIIYKYGLYIVTLAGEIRGIDKKDILVKYNEMQIHDKTELALEPLEICEYLNIEPSYTLKYIIDELIDNIINNRLINDKGVIKDYLKKYKK